MTEKTYKVGDVVAWADVPDEAMVRHAGAYYLRLPVGGHCMGLAGHRDRAGQRDGCWESWTQSGGDAEAWDWMEEGGPSGEPDAVPIVALGLTGQETAADLQRIAEVFEVRESVSRDFAVWREVQYAAGGDEVICAKDEVVARCIERLHAAGWRPGMTAEDAARLLAEHPK